MSVRLHPLMRFMAAVFCTSLAVALLGASAPISTGPTLVVFPFRTADGIDPVAGRDYAVALGHALQTAGGVNVVIADATTQPADFLKVTAANGGDYYISGFVSATVRGTSQVLEQLVSRRSGTAVWGVNAQIADDKDITDQGPVVRDALLTYASRGFYAIVNATPKPAPTKTPKASKKNGIESSGQGPGGAPQRRTLDLPNEAYGFSSAPTAVPKLYASSAHPARFAVLAVTGTVADVEKRYAEASLVSTLSHHSQPALPGDPETTKHWLIHPSDTCAQTGASYLVFGVLSTRSTDPTSGVEPWTDASYTPMVYDCTAQAYNRASKPIRTSAFDWKTAVDRATFKATTDFFGKLPGAASNHA